MLLRGGERARCPGFRSWGRTGISFVGNLGVVVFSVGRVSGTCVG